jgi:hypothetical protein
LEIEIVRLTSCGTSAMVTLCSTYFSGGSILFGIVNRIAVITDDLPLRGLYIVAGHPVSTEIALLSGMDICTETAGTGVIVLIGRRVLTMALDDVPGRVKDPPAICTDQHPASSSGSSMYYPQSQPRPSRKSLQGHLLSGFFSSLQGQ